MAAITILGPGGVGGLVAAALDRDGHDVTVVAREATSELIAERGISVRSVRLGEFVARPRAVPRLTEPVDALIVATKATGLHDALARIDVRPALVLPLLNGLDHMAVLCDRFGAERVAAGVIRVESDRPEPGKVVQTSPFLRVDLATETPALREPLERLAGALEHAGIPVVLGEREGGRESQIIWSKLVRLCALACTTTAADRPIGFIRSDPEWRARLIGCIEEAAAVARAEGADLQAKDTIAELEAAHPELGSSMQRDVAAGREPELDAIAGAVIRAGLRHGIACPTITDLAARIAERAAIEPPRVAASEV